MKYIKKIHTFSWGVNSFWEQNPKETLNDGGRASA